MTSTGQYSFWRTPSGNFSAEKSVTFPETEVARCWQCPAARCRRRASLGTPRASAQHLRRFPRIVTSTHTSPGRNGGGFTLNPRFRETRTRAISGATAVRGAPGRCSASSAVRPSWTRRTQGTYSCGACLAWRVTSSLRMRVCDQYRSWMCS
jgi:hypothetical protein